jgi:hypothetical protein
MSIGKFSLKTETSPSGEQNGLLCSQESYFKENQGRITVGAKKEISFLE